MCIRDRSMTLSDGTVWGDKAVVRKAVRGNHSGTVASPLYRSAEIEECYNSLTLRMKGNWAVEFRAYDDGIAYRFVSEAKSPFTVAAEEVSYRFRSRIHIRLRNFPNSMPDAWHSCR